MMRRLSPAAIAIVVIGVACAALLAVPGRTMTTAFVNDVLIFLDGANRIAFGLAPNRDFHSALGPVVFHVPALGYFLTGDFGSALPVGMAMLLLAFLPALIRVLGSRLPLWLAIAYAAFLILILAAPVNLGSRIGSLSFAMFYNRIGWVALALLLVMYLRPIHQTRGSSLADSLAAAFLLLVQIYTKATYGVVALVFLAFMLFDHRQRRWVATSLLLVLVVMAGTELFWRGTRDYLNDLVSAAGVSGGQSIRSLAMAALSNLADITVFAIISLAAIGRTRSLRDALFFAFCFGAGLLIIIQNAHGWGIITLYSGAVVAASRGGAFGTRGTGQQHVQRKAAGLPLLMIFFLTPPIAFHGTAVVLHAGMALQEAGRPIDLPRLGNVRYIGGHATFMARYIDRIASGGRLLQTLAPPPERVMVLDFVNPFSAGLGLRPPTGDSAWLHWGRNVDERTFLPPEELFADVEIVMIPAHGINAVPLQHLYGRFISENYALIEKSDDWTVYRKPRTAKSEVR
jgi:hypothetical protein